MEMQFNGLLFDVIGGLWAIVCALFVIWILAIFAYWIIRSIKR